MPTCCEVSRLCSDALERELQADDRNRLHDHSSLCTACSRYAELLAAMRKAARELALDSTPPPGRPEPSLSAEARLRLRSRLSVL